jgi:hypothetical protein
MSRNSSAGELSARTLASYPRSLRHETRDARVTHADDVFDLASAGSRIKAMVASRVAQIVDSIALKDFAVGY